MTTLPDGVGLDASLKHTEQPTNTFLIDCLPDRFPGWMRDWEL